MKKIIILVAMLLLGVHSINAARRAVYLSFSNNGLSGKKGMPIVLRCIYLSMWYMILMHQSLQ